MFRLLPLLVAASMLTTGAEASRIDQEARIAKELDGRVAGKSTDCIRQTDIRSSRIFDRTAIVYEMSNGTYYLNRPKTGAPFLDTNAILVTDTHSSELCGVDIVRLIDNTSRMPMGTIGLGPFIPYTKVKAKN